MKKSVLKHSPISLNLAPVTIFLVPKIEKILKVMHFKCINDIKSDTALHPSEGH